MVETIRTWLSVTLTPCAIRRSIRNAQFQVNLASWDFAQSYPFNGDKPYDEDDLNIEDDGEGSARQGVSNKTLGPEWSWDVGASGAVEVHL